MKGNSYAAKPATWNGTTYPSLTAAAAAAGVSVRAMSNRLRRGYTCDAELKFQGVRGSGKYGKPTTWDGTTYPSVTAAAAAIGITQAAMSARLRRGYTCDADMSFTRNKKESL